MQIINGKYVEGFYVYARQLPNPIVNNPAPVTTNTNPLLGSASASASALISTKPNIAAAGKRDGETNQNGGVGGGGGTPAPQSTKYRMLTILNGGGASSCTITGLVQYTLYEFFIVPFYKSVEGKPSNSRIARTLEDGELNSF